MRAIAALAALTLGYGDAGRMPYGGSWELMQFPKPYGITILSFSDDLSRVTVVEPTKAGLIYEVPSDERPYRCKGLPEEGPALILGDEKCVFGDVRRISNFGQGVLISLFFLFSLGAASALARTLGIIGKEPKAIWAAGIAACGVGMAWCMGGATTGYVWIPWM